MAQYDKALTYVLGRAVERVAGSTDGQGYTISFPGEIVVHVYDGGSTTPLPSIVGYAFADVSYDDGTTTLMFSRGGKTISVTTAASAYAVSDPRLNDGELFYPEVEGEAMTRHPAFSLPEDPSSDRVFENEDE